MNLFQIILHLKRVLLYFSPIFLNHQTMKWQKSDSMEHQKKKQIKYVSTQFTKRQINVSQKLTQALYHEVRSFFYYSENYTFPHSMVQYQSL